MTRRWLSACALAGWLAAGCAKPAEEPASPAETEVRAAVAVLQDVIKANDDAKLWSLLDAKAQTEADQAAVTVQAKYQRADDAGKADLEKEFGLPGAELAALTGPGYLKTQPFRKKYDELPESKIDKVNVLGKQATVSYTEPDGDRKKLTLMQRDGQWKAVLAMPKS